MEVKAFDGVADGLEGFEVHHAVAEPEFAQDDRAIAVGDVGLEAFEAVASVVPPEAIS